MNIVVRTKGELSAYELVIEIIRQKSPTDRLLIWDDFSPASWVQQMKDLAEIKQDRVDCSMSAHFNRVKDHIAENEWVVELDADERIQPGFIDAMREKMDSSPLDVEAIFIEMRGSYWHEFGGPVPPPMDYSKPFAPPFLMSFNPRAWRNKKEIHLIFPIHGKLVGYKREIFVSGKPFTIIHHRQDTPRRYEHMVKDYWGYVDEMVNRKDDSWDGERHLCNR